MTWLLKEELCVEVMEVRYDMVVERLDQEMIIGKVIELVVVGVLHLFGYFRNVALRACDEVC